MATQKNSVSDLVRLGHELRARGFQVYAHPQFGGVTPGAHDPKGAHYAAGGQALDVGRDNGAPISVSEQRALDRLAVELDARRFAVIWWRGPNDHQDHLHVATGTWRGAPGYRYGLSASRQTTALVVDGRWGPKTWSALAWALNRPHPRTPGWNTAPDVVRALQRVLRTEQGSDALEVDGRLGPATWRALGDVLGVRVGRQPTADLSSLTAVLQLMIVATGRVV